MTLTLAPDALLPVDTYPPLIGLHGFPRSGKDTAAEVLTRDHGYTRIALADPIRNGLLALDPWVRAGDWSEYNDDNRDDPRWLSYPYSVSPRRLTSLVAEFGWDGLKASDLWRFETRTLPQKFGTEVGREEFWNTFWLDLAERRMLDAGRVVVTDVRFANEAEWIRSQGGLLINIVRPGYGAVNNHASEAVQECDVIINNDSDVSTLLARLEEVVRQHGKD
jgi:hypothetical protein